jgi:hypothetical protein
VEHIKEIVEKTYRTKRVHCLGIFSIKMIRLSSSLDEMQQQFLHRLLSRPSYFIMSIALTVRISGKSRFLSALGSLE